MNSRCRVSVIMPLYNAEKYVKKAVVSILNQSFVDFELIIINDASSDSSYEIAKSIEDKRIKLYSNEKNSGIAYTRNRAISLAIGDYIAIMDDDDIASVDRLEVEVKYLDEHPEICAVIGNTCRIDKNDNDLCEYWKVCTDPYRINALLLFDDPIPNSSAMVRRSTVIDNNIRFRSDMYGIEDYRFWSEVSVFGLIGGIDKTLLYNRLGHGSESAVQNTAEAQIKRRERFAEIKDMLFSEYNIQLKERQRQVLYDVFSECRSTASLSEIIGVIPVLIKLCGEANKVEDKYGRNMVNSIRMVCAFKLFSTISTSLKKFLSGGKYHYWYEFSNKRDSKPKELES